MLRAMLAVLSLALAAGTAAQPPVDAVKKAKPAAKAAQPKPGVRPAWAELTAEQQQVLAPLKPDWDSLEPERRQKWIGIAKQYPRMQPKEQERVTRRMQVWAKLTPEQRRQARENYKRLAKVPREERSTDLRERWAEYQALPPHERNSLVPTPSTDPRRQKH
ncbi:MAG TPA: DUF3106 domain-containing protein [Burkholderiales bacterium]|nr:DUF3106 domain-containing protein [Burkholderiales bacterium]